MRQRLISLLALAILIVSISFVIAAKPAFVSWTNPVGKQLVLPENALEIAPGVFYLGKSFDNGRVVEGYAMFAKPGTFCGNDICEESENKNNCPQDCSGGGDDDGKNGGTDTSSCYGFLAKEAKWKVNEPYLIDSQNIRGLTDSFVRENIASDISKWETAVDYNILGNEISGFVDGADTESPDNKNEVYFADINEPGVIGVTIIWGIFSGPPFSRELVEWDMVFDDKDFDWSENAEGSATEMDFENIATHELGHAVGLADLFDSKCSEMTMYGLANYGETKKQTLEDGDVNGIRKLYK